MESPENKPLDIKKYLRQYSPGGESRQQQGLQFTYDVATNKWSQHPCIVKLDTKPLAAGGMRWCVRMNFMGKDRQNRTFVAKVFKPDAVSAYQGDRAYFDEAVTQTVAGNIAEAFNHAARERDLSSVHVRMLPVSVVQLIECDGRLVNAEPMLEGKYVKHNDNDGHLLTEEHVPHAFSHFSYELSGGRVLVCDIQGVGNYYTDPQIHSADGESFGAGNCGQDGINAFFQSHKCNNLCRRLGLAPAASSALSSAASTKSAASNLSSWDERRYKQALNSGIFDASRQRPVLTAGVQENASPTAGEGGGNQDLSSMLAKKSLLVRQKQALEAQLQESLDSQNRGRQNSHAVADVCRAHADQVVDSGKIASASPAGGSIDVRRLQQQQRKLLARMEELERIQHDRDQNLSRRDRTLSPVNYPRGDKKTVPTGRTNSMSPPPHAASTSSKSPRRSPDTSGCSKSPQRYADRSGSRSPDHPLARTGSSPQQIKQKQMELLARLQQLQAKQLTSPRLSRTGSLDRRASSASICHTSDPLLSRTASSERHRVSGVILRTASSERRPLSGTLPRTASSERHPRESASFGARHGEHKSRTQSPMSRPASTGSMSSEQLQVIMLKLQTFKESCVRQGIAPDATAARQDDGISNHDEMMDYIPPPPRSRRASSHCCRPKLDSDSQTPCPQDAKMTSHLDARLLTEAYRNSGDKDAYTSRDSHAHTTHVESPTRKDQDKTLEIAIMQAKIRSLELQMTNRRSGISRTPSNPSVYIDSSHPKEPRRQDHRTRSLSPGEYA